MIKVMKSTDDPRYSGKTGPRPILNVTHGISSLEITEFVKVAVETGHMKAVLAGLPEEYFMDAQGSNYYMVSKDGGLAPKYVHTYKTEHYKSAFESAYEEAERLARKEPGIYRVLRLVRTIRSQAVTKTEIVIQRGVKDDPTIS